MRPAVDFGGGSTVAAAPTPDGKGFWTVSRTGKVSTQGDATFYGDASAISLNAPIVGIAATFDGHGYWLLGSDGGVFSYGDASFYGSTGSIHLNAPALQMYSTPDSRGYWFVAADGGIFSYGDARFYGSTGSMHLNQPIVGMTATSTGSGYWLVASDGGIFSFGTAQFYGSTGSIRLNQPVVGMAATRNNAGYWLVAADGGVFAFGNAQFYGSASGQASPGSVVSIVATGDGGGYWIIADNSTIYDFGDAATGGGAVTTGPAPPALTDEYLGETPYIQTTNSPSCWTTRYESLQDSTRTIAGQEYVQSIYSPTIDYGSCQSGPRSVQYNLRGQYATLNMTIGLDGQRSSSTALQRFQVYGTGNLLFTSGRPATGGDLETGQAKALSLNVTGVLRLKLQVISLPVGGHYYTAWAVFGSAYVAP
ncbi:MAG TPA: NPCBM/NEW2 domain-containing protein [Acidimicrobiales bacterium]|nr:NPCBM/NEW2 domain-containing protein [Acidimicrobiales bacterium]